MKARPSIALTSANIQFLYTKFFTISKHAATYIIIIFAQPVYVISEIVSVKKKKIVKYFISALNLSFSSRTLFQFTFMRFLVYSRVFYACILIATQFLSTVYSKLEIKSNICNCIFTSIYSPTFIFILAHFSRLTADSNVAAILFYCSKYL